MRGMPAGLVAARSGPGGAMTSRARRIGIAPGGGSVTIERIAGRGAFIELAARVKRVKIYQTLIIRSAIAVCFLIRVVIVTR